MEVHKEENTPLCVNLNGKNSLIGSSATECDIIATLSANAYKTTEQTGVSIDPQFSLHHKFVICNVSQFFSVLTTY